MHDAYIELIGVATNRKHRFDGYKYRDLFRVATNTFRYLRLKGTAVAIFIWSRGIKRLRLIV